MKPHNIRQLILICGVGVGIDLSSYTHLGSVEGPIAVIVLVLCPIFRSLSKTRTPHSARGKQIDNSSAKAELAGVCWHWTGHRVQSIGSSHVLVMEAVNV